MNLDSFMVRKVKYVLTLLIFFHPHFISSQTITICGASFPPSTIVENGELTKGYSIELIAEAFSRLQLEYKLLVLPWSRCLKQVQTNDIDAVIDTSTHNQPIITGDLAISYNQLAIYVRKDFFENTYSAGSLKNQLMGVPRGYTSYLKIAKNHEWKTFEADNEENMFIMLKKGRFDYVFADTSTALKVASKVNVAVKSLKPVVTSEAYYLGFSPDNRKLATAFDQVLAQMIKDGAMDRIYSRYLPYSYTEIKKINTGLSFEND